MLAPNLKPGQLAICAITSYSVPTRIAELACGHRYPNVSQRQVTEVKFLPCPKCSVPEKAKRARKRRPFWLS